MTLEESIAYEEKEVKENEEKAKECHEAQKRKIELIPFSEMDYTYENRYTKDAEIHRQILEYLKELKQLREQSKWTPVTEKLPEEVGLYLVTTNRLGYQERAIDGFVRGRWEQFGHAVIAWRPLPEAYKESEE